MTDYSHLTNEQLNQLIHNLSIKSRERHDKGFYPESLAFRVELDKCVGHNFSELGRKRALERKQALEELVRESEALGLYAQEPDNWAGLSEDQKNSLRELWNGIKARWEPWSQDAQEGS